MRYEQSVYLDSEILNKINQFLTEEPSCEEECLGEDETITETVAFGNGYEMDIKCCGVKFMEGEGETNLAWTEAVLFRNGAQVAFTEPSDGFEGDWELEDNEGNVYVVHVMNKERTTDLDNKIKNAQQYISEAQSDNLSAKPFER